MSNAKIRQGQMKLLDAKEAGGVGVVDRYRFMA